MLVIDVTIPFSRNGRKRQTSKERILWLLQKYYITSSASRKARLSPLSNVISSISDKYRCRYVDASGHMVKCAY